MKVHRSEWGGSGDVLQRNASGAHRDRVLETVEETRVGHIEQGQTATVGAGQMCGKQLGIDSRCAYSGIGEGSGGVDDRLTQSVSHCCSRACLSAAASASSTASRSPSRT